MFVTFEGIEGTGKSTQIGLLDAWLREQGRATEITREPGGSRLGRELRRILLSMESSDLTGQAELFLYLADRAQHVATVIRPALLAGHDVLSDRFADSTVVYQGYGRGLDPKTLHGLNEVAVDGLWPDLTILLDIEPEEGLRRALARNIAEGTHASEGRFEAEHMEFHARVREGYLTWAALHPERFRVVDASASPEVVHARVRELVAAALDEKEQPGLRM
ncbi:Thymidylate kinase [Alkalidesulfovibrio alkalitolerans DSM 16529]|jgi:dTMP kinase|uniref:Thymidylate kinase n=1 Tax=Alkalidesulfovibrio alkalitolerans DSM 16529 TaxID=1121439 RepID=S7TG94_9BACT|nr:dTMP kinase [Alkalidesulfovibrio alkalitolerans]EPR36232.1 Thymidylate kinase [Alkalidesulfovibrio alkalitolerans DSM 16529]